MVCFSGELESIERIEDELAEHVMEVGICEDIAVKLCGEVPDNAELTTRINNRVDTVRFPLNQISEKLSASKSKLFGMLMSQQPLEESVEELSKNLDMISNDISLQVSPYTSYVLFTMSSTTYRT